MFKYTKIFILLSSKFFTAHIIEANINIELTQEVFANLHQFIAQTQQWYLPNQNFTPASIEQLQADFSAGLVYDAPTNLIEFSTEFVNQYRGNGICLDYLQQLTAQVRSLFVARTEQINEQMLQAQQLDIKFMENFGEAILTLNSLPYKLRKQISSISVNSFLPWLLLSNS